MGAANRKPTPDKDNRLISGPWTALWIFISALVLFTSWRPLAIHAQEAAILSPGDAVVTGFSGVKPLERPTAPGSEALDSFFIDTEGASAQVLRLTADAPPQGQTISPLVALQIKAKDVGQVFGAAIDNAIPPNIYLSASSAFGVQIAARDGDGLKRLRTGQAGAAFMPGQFGEGGPGVIYKVDGATGAVSVFARIAANSGAALGDLAYDPASRQFFVSDLDTGLIYRLDAGGAVLDSFDHGVTGRAKGGLAVIDDDGRQMNITAPTFSVANSETWGLTQEARRVWGLAVHDGRLYYAVWSGGQVWSVGVSGAGFATDPRAEFIVSGGESAPIAHMVFDKDGALYAAQRGEILGCYDYSVFAWGKNSKTLRFQLQNGQWSEGVYAIGFPPQQQNASGGVALGPGYDALGRLQPERCGAMVWATGDALRNDPARAPELGVGGALVVHGLQGNSVQSVLPVNAPAQSYFVDYDGLYGDAEAEGHVGSVAIYCPSERGKQPEQTQRENSRTGGTSEHPPAPKPPCPARRQTPGGCCPAGATASEGQCCPEGFAFSRSSGLCVFSAPSTPTPVEKPGGQLDNSGTPSAPPVIAGPPSGCANGGQQPHCCPRETPWNERIHSCSLSKRPQPSDQESRPDGSESPHLVCRGSAHWDGRACVPNASGANDNGGCGPDSIRVNKVCTPKNKVYACPPGLKWNGSGCSRGTGAATTRRDAEPMPEPPKPAIESPSWRDTQTYRSRKHRRRFHRGRGRSYHRGYRSD